MGQAAVVVAKPVSENRFSIRSVVIASADVNLRQALSQQLRSIRWDVREAGGGAEALALLEEESAEALLVDTWLPDLEVVEFVTLIGDFHPHLEVLRMDGSLEDRAARSPRRNELLLALRQAGDAASLCSPIAVPANDPCPNDQSLDPDPTPVTFNPIPATSPSIVDPTPRRRREVAPLPEMAGDSAPMRELSWLVRLVAPRSTTVLIEGATGTGKELVAKAVHRLSARAGKPFVVLNCAAIPESLLEAELFGHTRGAFTGAVQSRIGRVEAANGGTLFLDEIGEMPLALQAKMLRFLECGEIQRVGGNETMRVDVRIVAATHQPLKQRAAENAFRLDLYHRLAVFPVHVPSLIERMEDVPVLARFLLARFGEELPVKRLSTSAVAKLLEYNWPGNVRELAHVLERATILAEDRPEIAEDEIRF